MSRASSRRRFYPGDEGCYVRSDIECEIGVKEEERPPQKTLDKPPALPQRIRSMRAILAAATVLPARITRRASVARRMTSMVTVRAL